MTDATRNLAVNEASERRRHKRFEAGLPARFMLPDRVERLGEVLNISVGGLAIESDIKPELGMPIIVYVDILGRRQGQVVRCLEDGFAVIFDAERTIPERFLDPDQVRINPNAAKNHDRRFQRHIASQETNLTIVPDGNIVECLVLDLSLGGANIATTARPALGQKVIIGNMQGRVIRHHEDGIAIEFDFISPSWTGLSGLARNAPKTQYQALRTTRTGNDEG